MIVIVIQFSLGLQLHIIGVELFLICIKLKLPKLKEVKNNQILDMLSETMDGFI